MSRIYRVPFSGTITSAGGDTDLLLLRPAADKPIELMGWLFGQISEAKDAEEEVLDIAIRHFTATVTNGTGGSAVTPVRNYAPGDLDAAGFTARCNDTGVATTTGTNTLVEPVPWNLRMVPWERWIPEELRPVARGTGEALIVRLETALADDISGRLTFYVRELA